VIFIATQAFYSLERLEVFRKDRRKRMSIKKGQTVEGEIKRVVDEAAFVDIGAGRDAVVSRKDIDQLKGNQIVHIKEGETVPVYIYHMPAKGGNPLGSISKAVGNEVDQSNGSGESNPWEIIEAEYQVGDIVEGKVTTIKRFGAFVELPIGVEGLIHVSELEPGYTRSPWDVVEPGERVQVSIIKIEAEKERIGLSLENVLEENF
jgi:ribosomal protein S1